MSRGWGSSHGLILAEVLLICCLAAIVLTVGLIMWRPADVLAQIQDKQRQQDLALLQLALKEYAADHDGYYPAVNGPVGTSGQPTYYSCFDCGWDQASTNSSGIAYDRNNWIPELVEKGYLSSLPIDPLSAADSKCPVSGYIYLSGGVGYKIFSWCDPKYNLNDSAPEHVYCPEGAVDAGKLNHSPTSHEALKPFVDPARPRWGYAVYTYELACF